ncbi:MAG: hypothetical protein ABIU05_22495, partial [Nitrospirales bacterium]
MPSLRLAQAQSIPPSSPSAGLGFSANITGGAGPHRGSACAWYLPYSSSEDGGSVCELRGGARLS